MNHFAKTALALVLAMPVISIAATTNNTANVNVSPEERNKIETVVHQYLASNPEVIIESIQNFQKKQYEQAEKTVKQTQLDASQFNDALFNRATDPMSGNPKGKVSIVEFFDYQCGHCAEMQSTMEAFLKSNPDVRIIYKDWPIRGAGSELAARAAIAANKQGKYVEFNRALFKTQPPLDQAKIMQIAKELNLDVAKLQKDMDDKNIQNELKATMELAKNLKLFGTPAFFIAPTGAKKGVTVIYIPGQMNLKQLEEATKKVSAG